mmetsp:Transcript_104220/g.311229  ORF Transcript_104220/g.311229 Transcript_104220/m.311229 type:complete len:208 (-) Transcript_104220:229-852(-)
MLHPHRGFDVLSSFSTSSSSQRSNSSACSLSLVGTSASSFSVSPLICASSARCWSFSSDCLVNLTSASRTCASSSWSCFRRASFSEPKDCTLPSRMPAPRPISMRRPLCSSSVPVWAFLSSSSCRCASSTIRMCSVRVFSCSPSSTLRSSSNCLRTSSTLCWCSVRVFSFSPLRAASSCSIFWRYCSTSAWASFNSASRRSFSKAAA